MMVDHMCYDESIVIKDEPISEEGNQEESPVVQFVKLPIFSPSDPELWLTSVEALLGIANVTTDEIKFQQVVNNADRVLFPHIMEVMEKNTPVNEKYAALKAKILASFPEDPVSKLHESLKCLRIKSDQKPSQFLRLLRITAEGQLSEDIIRSLFIEQMPKSIRETLLTSKQRSLNIIADFADKMVELELSQAKLTEKMLMRPGGVHMTRTIAKMTQRVKELTSLIQDNPLEEAEDEKMIPVFDVIDSSSENVPTAKEKTKAKQGIKRRLPTQPTPAKPSSNLETYSIWNDHCYCTPLKKIRNQREEEEEEVIFLDSDEDVDVINVEDEYEAAEHHEEILQMESMLYRKRNLPRYFKSNYRKRVKGAVGNNKIFTKSHYTKAMGTSPIKNRLLRQDRSSAFRILPSQIEDKNSRLSNRDSIDHRLNERARRATLKSRVQFLRVQVPSLQSCNKAPVIDILSQSKEYIYDLQEAVRDRRALITHLTDINIVLQNRLKKLKSRIRF